MTDAVQSKGAETTANNILYCSFCGKSQHEVRKLIAGPTVYICDECVELCMDIIREKHRAARLAELGPSEEIVASLVARADRAAPGNHRLKADLALAAARRHTSKGGRISGLFAGPQGCGITQIIAGIWSGLDGPVLSLDATQLRTTRLFNTNSVCASLLEAADRNRELAMRGVVVIDNLDRIAKAGEEFRMIQEELELLIRGVEVPVPAGRAERQLSNDMVLFDTSGVSFFACTSTLHNTVAPVTMTMGPNEPKDANTRGRIIDALVGKGFLPELVSAFDLVSEFGSVTRSELVAFVEAPDSVALIEWRSFLREIGGDPEHGWADEVANEVQRQKTGLRALRGILATLSIRLAFELDSSNTAPPKVTSSWVRESLRR